MARKKPAQVAPGKTAVRITRDHDFHHAPAVVQAFKADTDVVVDSSVAKALIEAGVAEKLTAETED